MLRVSVHAGVGVVTVCDCGFAVGHAVLIFAAAAFRVWFSFAFAVVGYFFGSDSGNHVRPRQGGGAAAAPGPGPVRRCRVAPALFRDSWGDRLAGIRVLANF